MMFGWAGGIARLWFHSLLAIEDSSANERDMRLVHILSLSVQRLGLETLS